MRLTAKQILWIDEISHDKKALQETLDVALNFHANRLNEVQKSEREFWNEMAEIYDLDIQNKIYIVKKVEGAAMIVEKEEDETY